MKNKTKNKKKKRRYAFEFFKYKNYFDGRKGKVDNQESLSNEENKEVLSTLEKE